MTAAAAADDHVFGVDLATDSGLRTQSFLYIIIGISI
jgi:hypothetical protein